MKSLIVLIAFALASSIASATSTGFQQVTVPDPEGKPLAVGIWYPSGAESSTQPIGMFSQTVAADGDISGNNLPLILMSHGTGGSMASNYDTALALAQAGFVVAAVTHTGDNYMDQSYAGNRRDLIDRPRQIKRVLDYMISAWAGRAHLDASRIGMFGFSLGGFTTLVEIGGTADLRRTSLLCSTWPNAPDCDFIAQRHGDGLTPLTITPVWVHDARIKAAVVVAPAASFVFGSGGLQGVTVPVQLWWAEKDQQAPDQWNSGIVRKELRISPEEHMVPGVDHFVFLAPCNDALAKAVPQICTDAPRFDRTDFHRKFNQAVVDYFRRELKVR